MPHQRAAQTRTTSREVNARAAGGGPLPSCRDGARGHGDQSSGGEFGPSLRIIQCGSRKTTLCCLHGLRPITGIVDATRMNKCAVRPRNMVSKCCPIISQV